VQSIFDPSEKRRFFKVSVIHYIVCKIIAQGKRNQIDPNTLPTVLLLSNVIVMFGTELHAATAVGLNVNICEPMTTAS